MSTAALDALVEALDALVRAQPEWGLVVAAAWRASRQGLPSPVESWAAVLELAQGEPEGSELQAAVGRAAGPLGPGAPSLLLEALGHWLPDSWALALDELRGEAAWPDPAFAALARTAPELATRRVRAALSTERASPRATGLLYEALVAWQDTGQSAAPDALAMQRDVETAPAGLVDETARFIGRLRLASRCAPDRGVELAAEAVDWLGADDVYDGLWAVLARAPEAAGRLEAAAPRSPGPEVLLDLRARMGLVEPRHLDRAVTTLMDRLRAGEIHGRAAWVASWRLLSAATRLGRVQAVGALAQSPLTPWAIELATWRELRQRADCLDAVADLVARASAGPLDWSPPPPPWADLGPTLRRARLLVLTDPAVAVPSGRAWSEAP